MRNLKYLAFAFLLLSMIACNDDEPAQSDLIIGLWDVTSLVVVDCLDNFETTTIAEGGCQDPSSECIVGKLAFDNDGNAKLIIETILNGQVEKREEINFQYSFPYDIQENVEILELCEVGEDCVTGFIYIQNNTLTFITDVNDCPLTINAKK